MTDKILKLPLDRNKRHFVVGDIHGKYDSFMTLLKEADYDETNDIIYSVGDLVDRGPKSFETVEYFTTKPNAYTVLGNHEHMASCPSEWFEVWVANGGIKCMDSLRANGKDHQWLIEQVKDLPWVIEVGDTDEEGSFRIVHADYEIMMNDGAAENILSTAVDNNGNFNPEDVHIQTLIWSRSTITKAMNNLSNMKPLTYRMKFNPDRQRHTYAGHTPIRKITTVGDITFLDTWGSDTLSMVEAISGNKYLVKMVD